MEPLANLCGRSRALPERSPRAARLPVPEKEGVNGGTTGSPVLTLANLCGRSRALPERSPRAARLPVPEKEGVNGGTRVPPF